MSNKWDEAGGEPVSAFKLNTNGSNWTTTDRNARSSWNKGDFIFCTDLDGGTFVKYMGTDLTNVPADWIVFAASEEAAEDFAHVIPARSINAIGHNLNATYFGEASLDFASISSNSDSADLIVTVTGALLGGKNTIEIGISAMLEAGISIACCAVTADNTVSIRLRNNTGGAINPIAKTYTVIVRNWVA